MAAPRSSELYRKWADRLEWFAAGALTLGAIILQVRNWQKAGGLWRDEVAAVNLAQLPSWSAIWAHLEHESFPLLITILIRAWSALGFGSSDTGLRALGLLISFGLIAALWWTAWVLTRRPPMFSLLLVALSPVAIRWGGSLRAYGLGVLLALLTVAAMWLMLERVSRRRVAFAALISVLAVHTLYQNALVVLALCVSGCAVAILTRDWKQAGAVGLVGAVSTLSLAPYVGVIRRASEWNEATQVPIGLDRIWTVLHRALSASGSWLPWLWGTLTILAAAAALAPFMHRHRDTGGRRRELSLFLVSTSAVATISYYLFVKVTKFPTEEWYYLLWMGVMAITVDALIACRLARTRGLIVRPITAVLAAAFVFPVAAASVQVRATNVDLIANQLNAVVAAGDRVVVHPWFCAVTLARYYSGPAELLSLPPLEDLKLQRLDLFKEQMAKEKPLAPVFASIETTLRAGGTVWLVGHFPFANPPQPPPTLPKAGEGPEGWRGAPYMAAYGMEAAYFLQMNALQSSRVDGPADQPIHPFEDLPARRFSGWRRPRSPW